MNRLEDYFYNRSEKIIHKWHHYFDIYDKHFSKFIGKNPKILEIGVQNGGSLLMWKDYFGKGSTIVGMDIDENCKNHENIEKNIFVEIANQFDISDIQKIKEKFNTFDIIIDDGSHINEHIKFSFKELFQSLNDNGVYLMEDLHTSYWESFNGGYKHNNSIVEFSKDIIDSINGYHWNSIDDYTNNVNSISFYDSVIIIDKKIRTNPPIHSRRLGGNEV